MSTHLTAEGLINILAELPPSTPLFVRGYEDGVNYVTAVHPINVNLFAYGEWYYGQHETDPDGAGEGVELVGEHITIPNNETSN